MKKGVMILALALMLFSGVARSQDKGFGLGIILLEPTGISAKKWSGLSLPQIQHF